MQNRRISSTPGCNPNHIQDPVGRDNAEYFRMSRRIFYFIFYSATKSCKSQKKNFGESL